MNETVGVLCALGSALSWSVTSLMVSALAPGIGTFTINAARTTLTAVIVIAWMLVAGGLEAVLTLSMSSVALLAVSIVLAIAIGDTIFFGERAAARPRPRDDDLDELSRRRGVARGAAPRRAAHRADRRGWFAHARRARVDRDGAHGGAG